MKYAIWRFVSFSYKNMWAFWACKMTSRLVKNRSGEFRFSNVVVYWSNLLTKSKYILCTFLGSHLLEEWSLKLKPTFVRFLLFYRRYLIKRSIHFESIVFSIKVTRGKRADGSITENYIVHTSELKIIIVNRVSRITKKRRNVGYNSSQ